MTISTLQSFLLEHQLDADDIFYLVEQGIEMERLKLEIARSANADSVSCYTRIMEGERLLCLLLCSVSSD